jgi:alkylhydroperoxidase family enzyme
MPAREEKMALNLEPAAELEPELAAYFEKCREKLGFVPNVLQAYAFDNAKLKAFVLMADDLMLGDSGLSKLEREMIAVAQNYRAANLPSRQKAMLDFAVRLTEAPDKIEAQDRQRLREAGFSDRDIWDIAAVAAFYNMSNRLAAAVELRPNADYHYWARERPPPQEARRESPAAAPLAAHREPTASGRRRRRSA